MNKVKTLIFLDYDGVLCDSVLEAYLLSRYAFKEVSVFQDIDQREYDAFVKYRPYITNSWQYYNFYSSKQEDYNDSTKSFNQKFLKKREELMNNNYDFWLSLEKPTSFLLKIKELFLKYPDFFMILSTKNKESIINKFKSLTINFSSASIFDKKDLLHKNKGKFIRDNFDTELSILIDDSEENLKTCDGISNIKPVLANWGYLLDKNKGYSEEEVLRIIMQSLS